MRFSHRHRGVLGAARANIGCCFMSPLWALLSGNPVSRLNRALAVRPFRPISVNLAPGRRAAPAKRQRALIGAGGHAREVMAQMGEKLQCFVDDAYQTQETLPLSRFDPDQYEVLIAIGDSSDRSRMAERLPRGTRYFTFVHPTALLLDGVVVGEGSFIGAHCILTTNIRLGSHALLNRGNQVGHDAVAGDFLSLMPGSILSGACRLGDEVYLGNNACVKEKISVCSGSKFGMGAMVVANISEPGTYVGVPARRLLSAAA
jgi:sugar O-acyltransferase (sialic acid O-acetyltransferase NeuD family)